MKGTSEPKKARSAKSLSVLSGKPECLGQLLACPAHRPVCLHLQGEEELDWSQDLSLPGLLGGGGVGGLGR